MKRQVSLEEISDGRLYTANDLVKADCGGCQGCSACCRNMGTSAVLDPLDVFRMEQGLGMDFDALLTKGLELNVSDGLILPNLRMTGEAEACAFLNPDGRCGIHPYRPGVCRLFPLGRYYEESGFRYFLQIHECPKNRSKIKVRKWLDTPELSKYEAYIRDWHFFLERVQKAVGEEDEALRRNACLYLLKTFFRAPYDTSKDFYGQFYERLEQASGIFGA